MDKKKIIILFGGVSSEHEVSRVSAYSVVQNLPKDKYEAILIGITKDGRWFLYEGPIDAMPDGSWENRPEKRPAYLCPDRAVSGVIVKDENGADIIKADCVFPVLHGRNGEDGTMQGLLQISGIPFIGCDTLSSAICMDKAVTHSLLSAVGIQQAKYLWFYSEKYQTAADKIKVKIASRLGYPVFVKPAASGSSVGVSKVTCERDLDAAVRKAAAEGRKILVEEAITGQEVECSVIGNEDPEAAKYVGEILASAEFYDYDDKYNSGKSQVVIPARIGSSVSDELRAIAVRAYRMLGCRGFARVDFFVRDGKEVLLNELNTIPGFTPISMYPKLWEASGVSYGELLDRLIELALAAK